MGGLATLALAGTSMADAAAGSLLVFPEFNNQQGIYQIYTITNTHPTEAVTVEIVYIDGKYCEEFNRNIELTPLDTFSFLTAKHNPEDEKGYAFAFAKSSAGGDPISFNYLIGSNLSLAVVPTYSTNPFMFQAVGEMGEVTEQNDNGLRDLDNVEYSAAPDRILVPRFMGQNLAFQSELTLIGLSGGAQFYTTVDFLIYNDNEEVFSSEYSFHCWDQVKLEEISDVFSNDYLQDYTNHDLLELFGAPSQETGWFEMEGHVASSFSTSIADPAVLAVLREGVLITQAADLPFCDGERTTGSLLARSSDGTF